MSRIGFLSSWGNDRGLSMLTLNYCKMLNGQHELFILKQGNNQISDNYKVVDVSITESEKYDVEPQAFVEWLSTNKLDCVFFNEFGQWDMNSHDLVKIAKETGVKTYAAELVVERFTSDQTKYYDRILCPTMSYSKFMRSNKVRNFTYAPYSIDLKEFTGRIKKPQNKFTFFHPGGMGGVLERKNTKVVIEAFKRLNNPDTRLIITSQKPLTINTAGFDIQIIDRNLTRDELLQLYFTVDASILPSKWESIGIPILESLAAGVPVVTTDTPPMNEFVKVGLNGFLCFPDFTDYDGISIPAAECSPVSVKVAMENIMNEAIYPMLSRNAVYMIKKSFDLEQNKKYLLDFLKEDLQ